MVATSKRAVDSERAIEIQELDGKFYASSPSQGWYLLHLGDARHCPSCECAHHRYRLAGTKKLCRHLEALAAYLAAKQCCCPTCGQPPVQSAAPSVWPPWDAATEQKFEARRAALFGAE